MRKKNRIYAGALAGIFFVLLLFTYISMQVYRHSLPVVEIESIQPGTVKRTYTMSGVIHYTSVQEISLPVPAIVSELYVETGETVGKGMAVLKIDKEYLEMELIRQEIVLDELKDREVQETEERLQKLLAYDREKKEEIVKSLEELLEADGIIYALCQGEVRETHVKVGSVEPAGNLLVSICDKRGGAEITWNMEEEGILFERFYAELRMTDGHNSLNNTIVLENVDKSYDVKTNQVYYKAAVPESRDMLSMHDGEPLEVTAYYVSDVYPSLIPVSAVRFEADGTAYVFELKEREKSFGLEYYVRKQTIHVSDRDIDYIATTSTWKDSQIVVNSSQILKDRMSVWLEE